MYEKLVPELRDDPAGIGYAAMTDQQALDALKAATVERIRSSMSGQELFVNTVAAEFGTLTTERRQLWIAFCSGGSVNPGHVTTEQFVIWVFGAESQTVAALVEARKETISRTSHLGISPVPHLAEIRTAREMF